MKNLIKQYPFLLKYLRQFRDGQIFKKKLERTIKGKNNRLKFDYSSRFVNCKLTIVGSNNIIEIKKDCKFNNVHFFLKGNGISLKIGSNVSFNNNGEIWIEDDNGKMVIGDFTTFESAHLAMTEPYSQLNIGEDCMFSNGIEIRTGDSHSIMDLVTEKRINFAKNISIDDHVWVGAHVVILKGVSLQKNTIIATKSLVTKSFDNQNILIGGSPARILKSDVYWLRERVYN